MIKKVILYTGSDGLPIVKQYNAVCVCVSLSLSISLSLCLPVSVSLPLSLSLYVYLSLSVSVPLCPGPAGGDLPGNDRRPLIKSSGVQIPSRPPSICHQSHSPMFCLPPFREASEHWGEGGAIIHVNSPQSALEEHVGKGLLEGVLHHCLITFHKQESSQRYSRSEREVKGSHLVESGCHV